MRSTKSTMNKSNLSSAAVKRANLLFLALAAFLLLLVNPAGGAEAKERKHGADLVVTKSDGQVITGELLAVKGEELVLMDAFSLSGVSLNIHDIKHIKVAKKSRFLKGLALGILIGGASGALLGAASGDDNPYSLFSMTAGQKAAVLGIGFGLIGGAAGGLIGGLASFHEDILLDGRSLEELKEILIRLRAYARFPEDVPERIGVKSEPEAWAKQVEAQEGQGEQAVKVEKDEPITEGAKMRQAAEKAQEEKEAKTRLAAEAAKSAQAGRMTKSFAYRRIHFSIGLGHIQYDGAGDFKKVFENAGFSDSESGYGWLFGTGTFTVNYPKVSDKKILKIMEFRIEYSVSRNWAVGLSFTPLGRFKVTGRRNFTIPVQDYRYFLYEENYITSSFQGNAAFLTGAYMPLSEGFLKKTVVKLGAGIGLNQTEIAFMTSQNEIDSKEDIAVIDKKEFSRTSLALMGFAQFDYYLNRSLSFGFGMEYRYLNYKIEAFQLTGYNEYNQIWNQPDLTRASWTADIPSFKGNLGGFAIGLSIGFHL